MYEYIYTYSDVNDKPSFSHIHSVLSTTMAEKEISYCNWDAETKKAKIYFGNGLDSTDKTELDELLLPGVPE